MVTRNVAAKPAASPSAKKPKPARFPAASHAGKRSKPNDRQRAAHDDLDARRAASAQRATTFFEQFIQNPTTESGELDLAFATHTARFEPDDRDIGLEAFADKLQEHLAEFVRQTNGGAVKSQESASGAPCETDERVSRYPADKIADVIEKLEHVQAVAQMIEGVCSPNSSEDQFPMPSQMYWTAGLLRNLAHDAETILCEGEVQP
jgi:hypothetical protein